MIFKIYMYKQATEVRIYDSRVIEGLSINVVLQSSIAILGEHREESRLCVRHSQVQHRGRVPFRGCSDAHGLVLHERDQAHQRQSLQ